MSDFNGDCEASKKGKLPERWTDDDGYERDQDGRFIDPEVGVAAHEALERDGRGAALGFWQRIAKGERNVEIDAFIGLVADRLVEADWSKGSARRDAIVKAVGLGGQGHVDAILHTQKRKYTKLRDDRIAELLPLGLSEREIWGKLADEGLFESAPTVGSGQRVPPKLRKAIHVVREAEQARHREMIRGFENLAEKD